jgi:hypothetical protein
MERQSPIRHVIQVSSLCPPIKKVILCGADAVSNQSEGVIPLTGVDSVRRKHDIFMDPFRQIIEGGLM